MTGTYLQVAAALLFVVLLIVAGGFVLKKKQNKFGLMSIVSYQPFGPKKGVAALKIGKEVLLLGLTQNDIRLLRVFKDEDIDIPETEGFQDKFQKFVNIGAHRN
ncbi:MAG: flagellar biosynthetic protein FliO [Nitrospirae bacterium]|nr:flagellar biosynthetic protein FliO [Nitrospirota bacterium]